MRKPRRRELRRHARARQQRRVAHAVALVALAAACRGDRVQWSAPRLVEGLPAPEASLVIEATGKIAFDEAVRAASMPPGACPGSLRLAQPSERELYGVWWSPRADSSATLLAARSSDDGRTWGAPVAVDTLDRGATGCRRPAPSIAADSATGAVHVAYSLTAPEGAGVFFSHSMERGMMFHAPVPLVYGERPAMTSIAAHGDTVVVAYEDPNAAPARVAVAISRTMGHTFEERLPVSGNNVGATDPRIARRGRLLAVAWVERAGRGEASGPPVTVVRTGDLR
jgi:hypothetical protein